MKVFGDNEVTKGLFRETLDGKLEDLYGVHLQAAATLLVTRHVREGVH